MKLKYPQLCISCAKVLKEGRCLGCTGLENPFFSGNPDCVYSKVPSAQIGIQERIKL